MKEIGPGGRIASGPQELPMNTPHILNVGLRILGAATLLLGLALWSGRFYSLVGLHMALGTLVVLGLWTLVVLGFHLRREGFVGRPSSGVPWS
jgi:hypothetical protein